eukprot:112462_1
MLALRIITIKQFRHCKKVGKLYFTTTALVTGGNRGIGLAICKQFVENKTNVIMTTRRLENGINALQTYFTPEEQKRVYILELDITDAYSISDATKHLERNSDSIDILVNNAGVNLSTLSKSVSRKMINETLATNFYGTIDLTQAILPLLTTHNNIKSSLSTYPSRIITISNRDAALNKLSKDKLNEFLREDLDVNRLKGIMDTFKNDSIKYMNQQDEDECMMMKEGWLKCPYLMSYVGLNQFCRILGQKFNDDNSHWISAYCPGHCATDSTQYFGTRDTSEGAYGVFTLATMVLDNDTVPNGTFCSAFYSNDTLDSIELEVMDWKNPAETISWDVLCQGNL